MSSFPREMRIQELMKRNGVVNEDEEDLPDMEFDGGLKIPGNIWHKLYK